MTTAENASHRIALETAFSEIKVVSTFRRASRVPTGRNFPSSEQQTASRFGARSCVKLMPQRENPERLRALTPYSFILFSSLFSCISCREELLYLNAKKDALTCRTAFLCALKSHAPLLHFPHAILSSHLTIVAHSEFPLWFTAHSIWMHIILNTLHPSLTSWYLPPPSSSQSWHCISEKEVQISFRLQGSAKWLHLCQAPHAIAAYLLWVTYFSLCGFVSTVSQFPAAQKILLLTTNVGIEFIGFLLGVEMHCTLWTCVQHQIPWFWRTEYLLRVEGEVIAFRKSWNRWE